MTCNACGCEDGYPVNGVETCPRCGAKTFEDGSHEYSGDESREDHEARVRDYDATHGY